METIPNPDWVKFSELISLLAREINWMETVDTLATLIQSNNQLSTR